MKKPIKLIALLLTLFFCIGMKGSEQRPLPYWQDMNVLSVNKEQPRTTFMTYDKAESALSGKYENSSYYRLLNGIWKFVYVDDHRLLPAEITSPSFPLTDWQDIKVPGNWEVQGFGTPIYINHGYEFQPRNPRPPQLPEAIPAGVYRREIDIPADWMRRDIYLHLAGAKSGVYVYINGQEVGYSEDSKNPAEFLINPYIKEGSNTLVLKMLRWSTGSYLECQDFFRISGIERDVFLWSQPRVAVKDFRIVSMLDETCLNGLFKLETDVKNTNDVAATAQVGYELIDAKGHKVIAGNHSLTIDANGVETVDFEETISHVAAWTAEHPNLYKLLISISQDGTVREVVPFNVGFRRFEIKESEQLINGRRQTLFYVNGQPIKFKGVNIHEVSPVGGHYVTPEEMRKNFELMKLNNINSVRLSHYPQDRRFYEMCDEYGFYVYDEVNIESHGMYYDLSKGRSLGNNPDWLENHLFRTRTTYERNKNYPCVTILSLGNEAGNGYNFYQTYLWMKQREKSLMNRPVCYERALWEWNTDMYVPQYPSAAWLREIGEKGADRPIIPSEYAHAMGNSTGDLYGQWQAIYQYPHLQGGYIWEWMDHALLAHNAKGEPYWAYGGDYGVDQPSDGNFVADGIVGPDQVPHPAMAEVKYNHQNIGFRAVDLSKGRIEITNRFYFTHLDNYQVKYRIMRNEKKVGEAALPLSLRPQESTVVTIPVDGLRSEPGVEYFINFEVSTRRADRLVPKGHIVAYDQFLLPFGGEKKVHMSGSGPRLAIVTNDDRQVDIRSSKVSFVFDKKAGVVSSYKVNGQEYFEDGFGLRPNFWRAPNDNDYGNGAPKRLQVWKQSSREFTVTNIQATIAGEGDSVRLVVDYLLPAGNIYTVTYDVMASGMLGVSTHFHPLALEAAELPKSEAELMATHSPQAQADRKRKNVIEVPRIGFRFRLPAAMSHISYFGRGPGENYIDRHMGSIVALYKTTAEEMYVPYVRPQENGHRTDVRWFSATNKGGKGLLVQAADLLGFNALRNSVEDFDSEEADAPYQWNNFSIEEIAARNDADARNVKPRRTHVDDIHPRDYVEVCVDLMQQGVGGYDSWGARPIPEATIYADGDYKFSFMLMPVK